MLYWKHYSYLLQNRGGETEDLALTCSPEKLGIDIYSIYDNYPMLSNNWLLYKGEKERVNYSDKIENEAVLLPLFNNPQIVNLKEIYNYKWEYFFYHDPKFIIYRKASYENYITFEIYKINGSLFQKLKLIIQGWYSSTYTKIGKFLIMLL